MKDLCTIEIQLDGGNQKTRFIGEKITGTMVISCEADLPVSMIGYDLIVEMRGKMENKSTGVVNKHLAWNMLLKASKIHRFPIEFVNQSTETYSGLDMNTVLKLAAYVKVDKVRYAADKGLLKKWISASPIGVDKKFGTEIYLKFQKASNEYSLETEAFDLQFSGYLKHIISLLTTTGFIYLFVKEYGFYFAWGAGLGTAIMLIHYLIGRLTIGKITVQLKEKSGQYFEFELINNWDWKRVQKLNGRYEIHEETVDNRGTSSVTTDNILFKSPMKYIANPDKKSSMKFLFPEGMPGTMKMGDCRIYWLFVLSIQIFWGMRFTYKKEFVVFRK